MDDHNFDEFVKGRLDGYEDPSFDPSALVGFHEKLAYFRPAPWYELPVSQYMMAASLTLFTVVNLYLFWPSKEEVAPSPISQKNQNQTIIDSLTVVIEQLKTESHVSTQFRDSLLNRFNSQPTFSQSASTPKLQNGGLYLGTTAEIPSDLYHALMVKRMLVTENGDAYLITPKKDHETFAGLSELDLKGVGENYPWPVAGLTDPELKSRSNETPTVIIPERRRAVSSKMRNALEKHYSKGIGIYIAPHADLVQSIFSKGDGGITPRVGVTADWVLSPSLSVETGVDYSTTSINFDRSFKDVSLPPTDPNLGAVEAVQVKNSLVSAPIAIKYRQWISEKSQAFVKLGYTPYFSIQQEYQLTYDFDRAFDPNQGFGPGPGPNPNHHHVNSIQRVNDQQYYGNTGTVSLGITRLIKNKNKLEASVFYEKSIGDIGQEKLGMQLFGLRAAYWFNLR